MDAPGPSACSDQIVGGHHPGAVGEPEVHQHVLHLAVAVAAGVGVHPVRRNQPAGMAPSSLDLPVGRVLEPGVLVVVAEYPTGMKCYFTTMRSLSPLMSLCVSQARRKWEHQGRLRLMASRNCAI